MSAPYAEVIGDPIAHSKSPLIHNFWLDKLGIPGSYRRMHVVAEELPAYLESRRADPHWRGCNVTIPHKETIIPFLDACVDDGIGAVNCILSREGKLIGRNTDNAGVDRALRDGFATGVETGLPTCIIGAGGAARAAIASLDILSIYQLNLVVRDSEKGRQLLANFQMEGNVYSFVEAEIAINRCAGLINASPLGMTGCPPMPQSVLDAISAMDDEAFVFDMVYSPLRTELLQRADREGLRAVDGLTMLIGQAEHAFFHFFGQSAPSGAEAELRELLTR